MRNFTLLLAAAALTFGSAFAATPLKSANKKANINPVEVMKPIVQKSDIQKLEKGRLSRADEEQITGTLKTYDMTGWVWYVPDNAIKAKYQLGQWTNTIFWGDDNTTVYIEDPISMIDLGALLEASYSAETNQVTMELPQQFAVLTADNTPVYAIVYEWDAEKKSYVNAPEEKQTVVFDVLEDGTLHLNFNEGWEYVDSKTPQPQYALGIAVDCTPGYDSFTDWEMAMLTEDWVPRPTLPETVDQFHATLTSDIADPVDMIVGIEGNTVYLVNLEPTYLPDTWITGTIEGDKVVFENRQYLGIDNYWGDEAYVLGCYLTLNEDEAGNVTIASQEYAGDTFTLNYDAENRKITAPENFALVVNTGDGKEVKEAYDFYINPVIHWYSYNVPGKPQNPELLLFMQYDAEEGYAAMIWDIPQISVDDSYLAGDQMAYCYWLDDEPFILTPADYNVEEDIQYIPYEGTLIDATDTYYDVRAVGSQHLLRFFEEVSETVSCQSIYVSEDKQVYASEKVTVSIKEDEPEPEPEPDGIASVAADKKIVAVEYYNLAGARVSNPNGFCIMKAIFSDGTSKSVKVSVRK